MANSRLLHKCKLCMLYAGNWRIRFFEDKITQMLYYYYADVIRYHHGICECLVGVKIVILFLSGDMSNATYNLTLFLTGLLIATKTILLRRPKVMKLIDFIYRKEKAILESKNEGVRSIYEEHVGYVEKISKALIWFLIWYSSCGILSPVFYSLIANSKVMIFLMYAPFDQEDHYGLSSIIQALAIAIAAILYAASQTFYISVTVFVIMELKILQHKCRHFDEYRHEVVIGDTEFTKELIRDHQSIITFVQDFNDVISVITLLEFLVSSINIAAALFQILDGKNVREVVFAASNCLLLVGQVFILAWHANEIAEESVNVSTAVYEIPWYNKRKSISKMLIIMQIRAQRPLTLSLGPFGDLTNATAIKVMNTAYSYMTLMIQY